MKKLVVLCCFLAMQMPAYGASQWCAGTISQTLITTDGMMMINPSWRQDFVGVCNVNTPYKDIPVVTCLSWYGLVKAAMAKNSSVLAFYSDAPACASMPTYTNSPAPYYLLLQQ